MSPRITWAFAVLLDGRRLPGVAPRELSRLRRRADSLVSATGRREEVISSWLANRATVHRYSVATADAADVRRDARIALSGVSAVSSGLSAAGEVEGYADTNQLSHIEQEYLLVAKSDHAAAAANVILRSIDSPIDLSPGVPRLMVVVDLIDRRESRAAVAAERLLNKLLSERLWLP
jgi:hypothetical protein